MEPVSTLAILAALATWGGLAIVNAIVAYQKKLEWGLVLAASVVASPPVYLYILAAPERR